MNYKEIVTTNPIELFCDAIRVFGLEPPYITEPDKFYRFPGVGKSKNNTAGWCKLFNNTSGGVFGDFSSGISENWHIKGINRLTEAERATFNKHVAEAKMQLKITQKINQKESQGWAQRIWATAELAPDDHPYLLRKGIKTHGVRLYRGNLAIKGIECDGSIIVPLCNGGEIFSLQFISKTGKKRFLPKGRITGCYALIGSNRLPMNGRLFLCEGFATGAAISELSGDPVAISFNSGNLNPVAQQLIELLSPAVELVVACDNDRNTKGNPGMTHGREAAVNAGALIVWPDFPCVGCECSDFNDLKTCIHQKRGAC